MLNTKKTKRIIYRKIEEKEYRRLQRLDERIKLLRFYLKPANRILEQIKIKNN